MQELPVPVRLQRFVRSLRLYPDISAPTLPELYRRLPDGEFELIVRFDDRTTHASLVGTRTSLLEKPNTKGASGLLVRFRLAGAHPFFGRPLSALTDRVAPLEDLWPLETREKLFAAVGGEEVLRATADSLTAVLERGDAYDPASARCVRRAVRRIAEATVLPRIPALAAELGVSERQLRRGFDHAVGLSPKHYLRVVRFRRALRAARTSRSRDWAAIAEQVGYYDQAHLIGEFREMSGLTPSALVG